MPGARRCARLAPAPSFQSRYNQKCASRYDNPDTQTATALRMRGDKIKDARHLATRSDQRARTFMAAGALAVLLAYWL